MATAQKQNPTLGPILVQGLRRVNTFEELANNGTPVRESNARERKLPEHQKPSIQSELASHRGHGPPHARRNEDQLEDNKETGRREDVSDGHRALFKHFDKDSEAMASPYALLQGNRSVLKRDDNEQQTFLHQIALKNSRGMKENWATGIKRIIPWVVTQDPSLLDQVDEEASILEYASRKCVPIAYCLLNLLLDRRTEEVLGQECDGRDCQVNTRHPLIAFVKEATMDGTFSGCPHQLRVEILKYNDDLKMKLQKAARNPVGNKPCIHRIIESYCAHPDRNAVEHLVQLSGSKTISYAAGVKRDDFLLHLAVSKFDKPKEQDREALEDFQHIIKAIVDVCPDALYHKNRDDRTAYQELLRYYDEQKTSTDSFGARLREALIDTLKEACIGDTTGGHNKKLQFLYPTGVNERKINLDLGQHRPIGKNYVKAITEERFDKFPFESCLSYVCLPPRKYQTADTAARGNTDTLESYQPIFNFIKKQGVKKIFKVTVNDLVGPPHSDRLIVELTRAYNIQHWDWRKLDISSDTILAAAPDVKTVVMHSSGNLSTLQGWACKHGLARLQMLQSVQVVIHKGPEDDASLKQYQALFEERLQRRFEKNSKSVKVEVRLQDALSISANDSRDHGLELAGRTKKNHDWLNHMDKFTEGMRNYDHDHARPIVKVALIDDGIDPEKTRFRVQEGRTFDENGDTGLDHYYVDPGRHGTIMGRLISKMCPDVHLYVARLKKAPGSEISAIAAKEAVYWALQKNVDIISMSWTIPAKGSNPQETEDFQTAIAEAVRQKKLLFCALRESEEALLSQGFFPVGLEQVFRIGSATRTGNLVKTHSGDEKSVEFILPGLEVLFDNEEEIHTLNGSSVATALAAGLAALILFCADLVDQDITATTYQNHNEDRGQALRSIAKMKKVFETMSRESNQGKFPEVQKYFRIAGRDPTIEDIKSLINSLMSGFS
ncbi:hypothetical protein BJY04DRAFT_218119 [Aspergillus karnatakaensis]|uniref:uncharacterized protein n=1 Tax=Aspergillus karnatakaensis TaxID=1810916 RepID=UPI003CCE0315